jgi:geranylgeranyl diphosphate synthase type II
MQYNYEELKQKFVSHLKTSPLHGETPVLYEAANYILGLGGKRIRPILVLMAYNLYKDEVDEVLNAALGIEIFHNFTLVHDDILDEARFRRSKETVHVKYGLNRAILSGDLMFIYVYKLFNDYLSHKNFKTIFEVFNNTGIKICEGQEMDMNFESRIDVSIEEYLTMISYKTAVLLGCALQIGALMGDASIEESEHLYHFGLNLGIAFQLQDDKLDVFGEVEKVGKVKGGDILQNKKTYLYLKALELADQNQKNRLIQLYTSKTEDKEKVKEVTKLFRNLHVEEYSNQLQEAYQTLAFSHLDAVGLGSSVEQLRKVSELLLNRKS